MKKINNKGFTLLELIIAMSILTSVMFIGYNIFNKNSTLMHTQININKGQSNMNDINEYLTKDLEQTTSIELKIDGVVVADTKVNVEQKSTDKVLENAKQDIEDRLSKNNNFNYEYKLRLNGENKFSVYKVNIENKNKSIRYTLSLTDKNGVKVDFVNKELLKEVEVPFYIIGDDPYKVIMGYSDKKNNFNLHEFEVTSRIKQDLVAGEITPDPPTVTPEEPDNKPPTVTPEEPDNNPPTVTPEEPDNNPSIEPDSTEVNGDLIFEITKNNSQNIGKYNWDTYVKYNMLGNTSYKKETVQSESEFKNRQFSIFLANTTEQTLIRARISGAEHTISDKRIQKVVGMKIKLEGNIELNISQFDHIESFKEIKLNDTEKIYKFKELKKSQGNINGTINILPEEKLGDTSRIVIDFIYEE